MLGGEQNQFASLILCRDEFVEGMVALSSLVFFFFFWCREEVGDFSAT